MAVYIFLGIFILLLAILGVTYLQKKNRARTQTNLGIGEINSGAKSYSAILNGSVLRKWYANTMNCWDIVLK